MYGTEEMTLSAARCVGLCMFICMGSVFLTLSLLVPCGTLELCVKFRKPPDGV